MTTAASLTAEETDLLVRSREAQEQVLQDLQTLVNIDSPSGHTPGLTKIKNIVVDQLKDLGASVGCLPTAGGGYNIVAVLNGEGKDSVLLLAHQDTVFKVGTAAQRPFKIEDGRAYGPGVSDNKAAVVIALHALRLLKETGFRTYGRITLLINSDEEMCSVDSRELIQEMGKQHDYAICLEAGGPANSIVGWRKGSARATLEVRGRASHAGVAPEHGANALVELAHQIAAFSNLADEKQGTSVSVTVAQAGDKINVIPDYAAANLDIRARYPKELERVAREGAALAQKSTVKGTKTTFTFVPNRPAFPGGAATDALVDKVRTLYQKIGVPVTVDGSGGGSDGNWTAHVGTPTIDGMSFVGDCAHTEAEYLDVGTIPNRLFVLAQLLKELSSLRK